MSYYDGIVCHICFNQVCHTCGAFHNEHDTVDEFENKITESLSGEDLRCYLQLAKDANCWSDCTRESGD